MEPITHQQCSAARKARDARFDGLFFVAVKTTNIYCRPICPAPAPKEKNVVYYQTAHQAAADGYRPCLRCRPDSAPNSFAWQGTHTSFVRAVKLIEQGALQHMSVTMLADKLGMTSRHLRQLFQQYLGVSPKQFASYRQCLFAKQLLHQTSLPITDIAFAAGFKSIRRFNDEFKQRMQLTPRQIRQSKGGQSSGPLTLKLSYRPPFAWQAMMDFLTRRVVEQLEWSNGKQYFRTIQHLDTQGVFAVSHAPSGHAIEAQLWLNQTHHLHVIVDRIKQLFDLHAASEVIDQQLQPLLPRSMQFTPGLRVPGIWSTFEAGIRAILGQQVSVTAARNYLNTLVAQLGRPVELEPFSDKKLFPEPIAIANSELDFFRMPAARKQSLRDLAQRFVEHPDPEDIEQWQSIKGIGKWTVDYVKMRGQQLPDIWLGTDLGIKRAMAGEDSTALMSEASPFRSYLTFQVWNQPTR